MYLEERDFLTSCDKSALEVLQKSDPTNREKATKLAMAEVASFISSRMDMKKEFEQVGEARNQLILGYTLDIAIFKMSAWLPSRMGYETREESYRTCIKRLEGVRDGKITLTYDTPSHEEAFGICWGSDKRNNNDW